MNEANKARPQRRRFSGRMYFTLQQTEMAMRAEWINEWLDNGETVLGQLVRDDQTQYASIDEAMEPGIDDILCKMADGKTLRIYGYKREPAAVPAPTKEDEHVSDP
jgi:hypothetical protein